MRKQTVGFAAAAVLFAIAVSIAGEGPPTVPAAVARGKALFQDTQRANYPSCAQCHSVVPEAKEKDLPHVGPGETLYGAAVRKGWRGRESYGDVGEASQYCAKQWQQRKHGLTESQRSDLVAYLKTVSPAGPLPMLKRPKEPKILDPLSGGNAARGKKLVAHFCAGCHSDADDAVVFALVPRKKRSEQIARKVRGLDRRGRFDPAGRRKDHSMSYFSMHRLGDGELRDIVAYLGR